MSLRAITLSVLLLSTGAMPANSAGSNSVHKKGVMHAVKTAIAKRLATRTMHRILLKDRAYRSASRTRWMTMGTTVAGGFLWAQGSRQGVAPALVGTGSMLVSGISSEYAGNMDSKSERELAFATNYANDTRDVLESHPRMAPNIRQSRIDLNQEIQTKTQSRVKGWRKRAQIGRRIAVASYVTPIAFTAATGQNALTPAAGFLLGAWSSQKYLSSVAAIRQARSTFISAVQEGSISLTDQQRRRITPLLP